MNPPALLMMSRLMADVMEVLVGSIDAAEVQQMVFDALGKVP